MRNVLLWGAMAVVIVCLLAAGWLALRASLLTAHFSQIHPDETEAKLLEVVGVPTRTLRCDEGRHQVQPSDVRPCARVHWYSSYPFDDGWLVPIDTQGTIMQIDRHVYP